MRKRSLCLTIPILLTTGCQSGPPGCSDTQTLEILRELLNEQAKLTTVVVLTAAHKPFGFAMLAHASDWLGKAQSGSMDAGEAYLELAEKIETLPLDSNDWGVPMLKAVVAAARYSSAEISGVATQNRTEHKTTCSATVAYTLNWPTSQELGEGDPQRLVDRVREMMGTAEQDIEFTTYYADDGTHYVEYVELDE